MIITDAQIHIWKANTPERPWRAGITTSHRDPLEADEVLREMDAAGVARAVLIPPFLDDDRNDVVLAAARAHPMRFAAMGQLPLEDPASPGRVAAWREQPGMLGFRFSFHRPAIAALLAEDRVDWLWSGCEKAGIPVMINVEPHVLSHVERVVARFTGLKLILCHMALPVHKQKDEEAFRDFDKLLPLAKYPNLAVKVTALPCYTNDPYPHRALHPYLRRVYETFGPKRMFWGTDYSRLPKTATYRQVVTMFTEEMTWLPAGDLEWIMGRALSQWLDWPADGRAHSPISEL